VDHRIKWNREKAAHILTFHFARNKQAPGGSGLRVQSGSPITTAFDPPSLVYFFIAHLTDV